MERMPKGPRGEIRPADVIGCAVMVGRLSVGEIAEDKGPLARKRVSGVAGGRARSQQLSDDKRAEIARVAASARWKKEATR